MLHISVVNGENFSDSFHNGSRIAIQRSRVRRHINTRSSWVKQLSVHFINIMNVYLILKLILYVCTSKSVRFIRRPRQELRVFVPRG